MKQSANDEEECGICLDALTNPVALPCSHKFCSECLNGWRSKYGRYGNICQKDREDEDDKMDRKCPLCREMIPPTKEMLAQLKFWRSSKSEMEAEGNVFSQRYMNAKDEVEKLEREIGDWTETIDHSDDNKECLLLPNYIWKAAKKNNIQKILNWLGPLPVDKQRVNARCPEFLEFTLVFCAVVCSGEEKF